MTGFYMKRIAGLKWVKRVFAMLPYKAFKNYFVHETSNPIDIFKQESNELIRDRLQILFLILTHYTPVLLFYTL